MHDTIDWTKEHFLKMFKSFSNTLETLSVWFQKILQHKFLFKWIKLKVKDILETFYLFHWETIRRESSRCLCAMVRSSFLGSDWVRVCLFFPSWFFRVRVRVYRVEYFESESALHHLSYGKFEETGNSFCWSRTTSQVPKKPAILFQICIHHLLAS